MIQNRHETSYIFANWGWYCTHGTILFQRAEWQRRQNKCIHWLGQLRRLESPKSVTSFLLMTWESLPSKRSLPTHHSATPSLGYPFVSVSLWPWKPLMSLHCKKSENKPSLTDIATYGVLGVVAQFGRTMPPPGQPIYVGPRYLFSF